MKANSLFVTSFVLCACWAFSACDATGEPDAALGGAGGDTGGGPTAGSGGGSSSTGGAPVQGGGSSSNPDSGGSSAVDSSGGSAAGGSSSPLGGAPPGGGTSSTGGADEPDPSGGVSSGGGTEASGGQPSGGRTSNLGGATSSGGRTSSRGGAAPTGGTGPGGGTSATGGTSASCTDIVPPGNDSCANAVEWGWCTADWIGDYCAAACGRCGSTGGGGTGTGGSATGGGSASPTGGTTGSGNLSVPRLNGGQQATTTRYWDCCKPSCAWAGNVGGKQPATSCGKDGNSTVGADAKNACEAGGTAFQCNWGVPWQVGPSLSYGYVAFNSGGCGTCYQLDFPNGKTMIVQAINIGAMSGNNFDLLIPGGGVGAMNACTQNGAMWGNVNAGAQHGGFLSSCGDNMSCITDMCRNAFGSNAALMAGCEWFTGWFGAQDNPNVTFAQTNCPDEITNKSGLR